MWYVGQVLRHVESGDLAVFAGFDDDGWWFFTPEETKAVSDDYTHIEGEDGRAVIGDFIFSASESAFFGRIKPDCMNDADWEGIRHICA